ncbi:hypothetical protein COW36_01840 [bacterium (Candidatus Blackallbacteria) CG17_big_fil_post_rev_8_21_14_2_50_48_46]|uniref:Proteinase inhibitor I42 chagasin domain-containing protein n=1 Tax=bacterium (Candidatus Blackallbacteria) CG17_big_fil_post_rev_8_21_14_2_50_48_46 TaxID=2014261 RepID=A0A2M7GB59_9BACT|nr:MAG: hypothetical protein COW64_26230 [bacterium (Candidatus Blackallbacteria) CG18_big_fil_WC_8_21_14_2_50_49_26]PIW19178.1 MAG: hypothetical protein COW36_01840 [bacterium (Candidatus Blackallbacteria) CG17_big_fil_post_rev_8_21_14_2_50_48_46]PIW45472.1 MAG: hypothetical protein COW20_20300 [bacterium (Candidatus Blackallbacteria) CG13_big_fil_rev_8_21_14_2_50_49_14]
MKRFLFLLVLAFSLPACRQPNPTLLLAEPVTPDKSQIYAELEQEFQLVMPASGANSLYRWERETPDNAFFSFVKETSGQSIYPKNPPPGYEPDQIFVFKALKIGQAELVFKLAPRNGVSPESSTRRSFLVVISKAPSSPQE